MRKKSVSVSFIFQYVALGLVPMLVVIVLFARSIVNISTADTKEMYQAELNQVAYYVESHIQDTEASILRYTTNPHFVSYLNINRAYSTNLESVDAYLFFLRPLISTEFLGSGNTRHLYVYYLNPNLIQAYNIFLYADEQKRQLPQYRCALDTPVLTTGWYFSPEEKIVYGSRAIRDNNARIYGVLSVYESSAQYDALFAAYRNTAVGLYLLDENDRLIASSMPNPTGTLPEHPLVPGVDNGVTSTMCYTLGAGSPPWRIVMEAPTGQLKANAATLMERTILISVAIGLLCAAIMTLSLKHSLKRLKPLVSAMHSSDEKLQTVPYEPPTRQDEIDEITTAYNALILRIEQLITENYRIHLAQKEAELYALQSQVNPHFIYNLLEQVRMRLLLSGDEASSRMVFLLSHLLRHTLRWKETYISLGEEIEFLQDYLELQRMRYSDRLSYELQVPEELLTIEIPRFTLQPLVENCLKHGFVSLDDTGSVWINAQAVAEGVQIVVGDDSPVYTAEVAASMLDGLNQEGGCSADHVGISNVHMRLRLHYGAPYGVASIVPSDPSRGTGWVITVLLPKLRLLPSKGRRGESS